MTTSKLIVISSSANQLTTELNSLANGSAAIASTAYDNATNLAMWATFELNVTYGTNPTAGSLVSLYLVPSADGTNYADATTGASPLVSPAYYVGAFWLRAVTTAQRVALANSGPAGLVALPGLKFKCYVINSSGQTMAASGNTLSMTTFGVQTA